MKSEVEKLKSHCMGLSEVESIYFFLDTFSNRIALSSSLGAEDQVLTDIVLKYNPNTTIFTLDTGRLHPETYLLMEKTNSHYNSKLQVYFPDASAVESMVRKKGLFSFYESIDNRKECCAIRKVEPLKRALQNLEVWITGMRREQSITRTDLEMIEWDESNNLIKFNPLVEWTNSMVWDYIHTHKVPYNSLHDKGFASIGCAPCTRAINPQDDIRSGRWWWENPDNKECGLHKPT